MQPSQELAQELVQDAAEVMRLAGKAGINLRASGGLTMTGLLSCASHSEHDEWMHWMLKNQGQNFKKFARSTSGALTKQDVVYSMRALAEEKSNAAALEDEPPSRADDLDMEIPRQRALEQALKFRADTELDRMLLSAWTGPVDDALDLLGNAPTKVEGAEQCNESPLASPIFANPRGLSAVRTKRISHRSEQHLAQLAQPSGYRTNLDRQFEAASTPEQLKEQVRSGNLTITEYKKLCDAYESQRRRESLRLGASPPPERRTSPTLNVRRPRSAAHRRDRFDRDLEVAAAACWTGDELAARQYVQGLATVGMNRAVRRVQSETVAKLLGENGSYKCSAQQRQQSKAGEPSVCQQRADLAAAIGTRTTLLHIAAAKGHENVVAALLGTSVTSCQPSPDGLVHLNAENEQHCTALIAAVMAASSVSAEQLQGVVSALISAGANVNAQGSCGVSALHIAAADGHVSVAQMLLGAGAAVDKPLEGGATPLLLAAQRGNMEMCGMLILAGADVMHSDADGLTPLMAVRALLLLLRCSISDATFAALVSICV